MADKQRLSREMLLDLRLPHPPTCANSVDFVGADRCACGDDAKTIVDSATLTEEGYRAVVSLRSTPRMADFIARVAHEVEAHAAKGCVIKDRRGLLGFARWFSGEACVQSLAQILRELPSKEREGWITFAPPPPTRCMPPPPTRRVD